MPKKWFKVYFNEPQLPSEARPYEVEAETEEEARLEAAQRLVELYRSRLRIYHVKER